MTPNLILSIISPLLNVNSDLISTASWLFSVPIFFDFIATVELFAHPFLCQFLFHWPILVSSLLSLLDPRGLQTFKRGNQVVNILGFVDQKIKDKIEDTL